jgi:hypothetical protein
MDREAVLEAVRTAGVLGNVPADRADDLTRGVGRVVAAVRRDAFRDLQVRHAGFDGDPQVRQIDVEHAIQARKPDQHTVGMRQRPARESSAMAAGHERHVRFVTEPDDRLHLRGARRKHDCPGNRAQVGERVRLVREEVGRIAYQCVGPDGTRELASEGGVDHRMILSPVGTDGGFDGLTSSSTLPAE